MRTAHSKNIKIGENIAYEMLKRSIKTIFGFFDILTRNKKLEFFGQIIKSILQSVNGEEKLTRITKFGKIILWQDSKIFTML